MEEEREHLIIFDEPVKWEWINDKTIAVPENTSVRGPAIDGTADEKILDDKKAAEEALYRYKCSKCPRLVESAIVYESGRTITNPVMVEIVKDAISAAKNKDWVTLYDITEREDFKSLLKNERTIVLNTQIFNGGAVDTLFCWLLDAEYEVWKIENQEEEAKYMKYIEGLK
jgi:hypothetical protein